MNVIDQHTGKPDPGLQRDAALEFEIDATYDAMVRAPTDAASREHFTQLAVLIGRRSKTAWLKIELERRAEIRARRKSA